MGGGASLRRGEGRLRAGGPIEVNFGPPSGPLWAPGRPIFADFGHFWGAETPDFGQTWTRPILVDTGAPKRSILAKLGAATGPILVNFGPLSRPLWASRGEEVGAWAAPSALPSANPTSFDDHLQCSGDVGGTVGHSLRIIIRCEAHLPTAEKGPPRQATHDEATVWQGEGCQTRFCGKATGPRAPFNNSAPLGGGGPQYANFWAPLTRKQHTMPHPAQPQHTNDGAPRTRKRQQQEHRPQRPTERSYPTQHAKGRTGDFPGPRKGAITRRNVTRGVPNCPLGLYASPPPVAMAVVGWFLCPPPPFFFRKREFLFPYTIYAKEKVYATDNPPPKSFRRKKARTLRRKKKRPTLISATELRFPPPPPTPLDPPPKFSSGPSVNQNISLAPSAPIGLDQKFVRAPLKSEHQRGGGGGFPTPPL